MATTLRSPRRGLQVESVLIHLLLLLVAIATFVPFYWMVSTAFKAEQDIFKFPPELIPSPLNLRNFPEVFVNAPMIRGLWNSTKVAVLATAGTVFTSALAAYAFAKINFRMKHALFILFLATLMIPGQVTLIPLYILFSRIGWIDTHWPLIVPPVLINTYGVFLLRQFMLGIPNAYVESAKIDGANHFRIFWSIVLPLCKPALVTLSLFSFIGSWNNFLGPLIFLSTDTQFTVPLIINSFRTIYYVQWGLLMAAATVAVLPILVLYLFGQRFFIEGISLAGLKG